MENSPSDGGECTATASQSHPEFSVSKRHAEGKATKLKRVRLAAKHAVAGSDGKEEGCVVFGLFLRSQSLQLPQ